MWAIASRYSGIGLEMVVSVALGALGGQWLDERLGTAPWLFWICLVAGLGAAVRAVMRVLPGR
jgi:F0F1-type ATP synthase assembly protein I